MTKAIKVIDIEYIEPNKILLTIKGLENLIPEDALTIRIEVPEEGIEKWIKKDKGKQNGYTNKE